VVVNASRRKWAVLAAVGAATIMAAHDSSIVSTMLPIVARELAAPISTIEWVITAYLLVVSAVLLAGGRAGDVHGHRVVFLTGLASFTASSALCGLAPTTAALIACRAIQGVGAALLLASAPAILSVTFPGAERGRALGMQAMMTYVGLTIGPALGGWLTGRFGWRRLSFAPSSARSSRSSTSPSSSTGASVPPSRARC
jgi:MFS family permease